METTQIQIPTYDPDGEVEYDYTRPYTLTLQEVEGLRVVMGDPDDEAAPDVSIERAVDLWRVFVTPDRGDALCIIEIRRDRATIEDDWGNLLLETGPALTQHRPPMLTPGTPDLAFPPLRKIINVNGCFWHMHGCARCRVP